MQKHRILEIGTGLTCLVLYLFAQGPVARGMEESSRRTPLVEAVANCRDSVVNLRGRKMAVDTDSVAGESKMVNGMGTAIVIDQRGYLLTNYHVVEDVKNIEVTLRDRQQCTAKLVAHDPQTDLAIIKIMVDRSLPVIQIGRSADLMLAESVAAVGNAYGYEHTVTTGIVSHLDRTVQVNDHQIYENLIQTDAPINPGNSGGPLINLDGEMIGVNVAVRIGAQGIAFAIPVDKAMEVTADLLARHNSKSLKHGLVVATDWSAAVPAVVVRSLLPHSSGASSGLLPGDVIVSAGNTSIVRASDFHLAMLDRQPGDSIELQVRRNGVLQTIPLRLESSLSQAASTTSSKVSYASAAGKGPWVPGIGMTLQEATPESMYGLHADYTRGLRVVSVQPGSPAALEGVAPGDILVVMHGFKMETLDHMNYVLGLSEIRGGGPCKFYVLRGKELFLGEMRINPEIAGTGSTSLQR